MKLEIGVFADKTTELYKELSELYVNYGKTDWLENVKKEYNEIKAEDKICISFVGQYSAGKSTIIKALTGDSSILIDSDIATSSVKGYNWGENFILMDTPGLNTNENQEHDAMTQEAIKKSDLLIYCITSDLFNGQTKIDFKNLASNYKEKLFLVVNKMSKESGEYNVLVKNYSDSINKTLAPDFSLSEFHHFFVDAADYVDGLEEKDRELIEDSHFEGFIDKLNQFTKSQGIRGKMATPVTILIDSVDNSLISIQDNEHDKDGKKIIKRICVIVDERKKAFIRDANDEVRELSNAIIQKGDDVALQLGDESFKFDENDLNDFIEPLQEELCEKIRTYFEKYAQEVDEEVKEVFSSELATHYFEEEKIQLNKELKGISSGTDAFKKIQQGLGKAASKVPNVSSFISKFSNVSAGEKVTIWAVRGSDLHKTVLKVGKTFGHKFKPFEALKFSKNIATVGKFLGPGLAAVGVFKDMWDTHAENKAYKELEKAKEDTRTMFRGIADDVGKCYRKQIENAAMEFEDIIGSLNKEMQNIDSLSESNKEFGDKLSELMKKLSKLKHEIEYTA